MRFALKLFMSRLWRTDNCFQRGQLHFLKLHAQLYFFLVDAILFQRFSAIMPVQYISSFRRHDKKMMALNASPDKKLHSSPPLGKPYKFQKYILTFRRGQFFDEKNCKQIENNQIQLSEISLMFSVLTKNRQILLVNPHVQAV